MTNLTLVPNANVNESAAAFYIKKNGVEYLICALTRENPHKTVNLFATLNDRVDMILKGGGKLHMTGFVEPEHE